MQVSAALQDEIRAARVAVAEQIAEEEEAFAELSAIIPNARRKPKIHVSAWA